VVSPVPNGMSDVSGVEPAPPEKVRLWCDAVKVMGPDALEDFERRTFAAWDRASLGDLPRRSSGGGRSSLAKVLGAVIPIVAELSHGSTARAHYGKRYCGRRGLDGLRT